MRKNKTQEHIVLNESQRQLVEDHLKVVEWVIYNHINVNESAVGLGYEDMLQTGYLSLCKAAFTYNGTYQFATYAQCCVRNALYDYCEKMQYRSSRTVSLNKPMSTDSDVTFIEQLISVHTISNEDDTLSQQDAILLLDRVKPKYNGIALKGIEAMELKIKGYTGKEIAQLYGVKQSLLGAWISRASKKLSTDPEIRKAFSR